MPRRKAETRVNRGNRMANKEKMPSLAGSCPKATAETPFHTYLIGKPQTVSVSSVGRDVEPGDLLLLLVEIGTYFTEHFGAAMRHATPATVSQRLVARECCMNKEAQWRLPTDT